MTQELVIVCVLGGLIATDTTAAFQVLLSHPLVGCTLVGIVMHHITLGLTVGIVLELPWLVEMPVGGARFSEGNVGSLVAAAVAVLSSRQTGRPETSFFLAAIWGVAVAHLAGLLVVGKRYLNVKLIHNADRAALAGSSTMVSVYHLIGIGHSFLMGTVASAAGILLGRVVLNPIIQGLPLRMEAALSLARPVLIGVGVGAMATIFAKRKVLWALALGIGLGALVAVL